MEQGGRPVLMPRTSTTATLERAPHLLRGQTDAVRVIHGVEHVGDTAAGSPASTTVHEARLCCRSAGCP
jgi:hypothetical protein